MKEAHMTVLKNLPKQGLQGKYLRAKPNLQDDNPRSNKEFSPA